MKNRFIYILLLFLFYSATASAQDAHFSQFYNSPLTLNPASTGVFDGNYRFNTSYKNQWQNISSAYKTIFAGFDMAFPKKNLGVGISVLNDKAGKSKMGITQGNVYVSYNLRINGSNRFITGIQYGAGQRSVRTDGLKWDSQFNGASYDPNIASGEPNYSDSYTYMDVGAGMMWNYTANHSHSKFKTSTGFAMFHLNQPNLSYYTSEKLNYKMVGHFNLQYELSNSDVYLLPQLIYVKQGAYTEIDMGTLVKFAVGDEGGDLIRINRVDRRYTTHFGYLGGQLRYKDAVTIISAFELRGGLMFSASYDINISKLHAASQFRGGPEVSLTYRGYFN